MTSPALALQCPADVPGLASLTWRVTLSPICPQCHTPADAARLSSGGLVIVCPACSSTNVYDVPADEVTAAVLNQAAEQASSIGVFRHLDVGEKAI